MRKFSPTKTFKTPSKSCKTTTKTIKRLQIPESRSLWQYSKRIGNFERSAFFCIVLTCPHRNFISLWKKHGHDGKFEHCACMHITMRIGVHDLFCGRPFETPGFSVTKFYNQCRGSGSDRKFKVAVEGIKFTTGFWRYRPKRLLFELASRKSRTLGVGQNCLIFWRPGNTYLCWLIWSYADSCLWYSAGLPCILYHFMP